MNISDFVTQIGRNGLARSNRYSVEMVLPATTYGDNEYRKMLLLCESVQLPGLNLNTAQIRTFGEIREMPYELNYDPVTFSFYVDGEMVVKGIFDQWINSVQRGNTRNFNYYENYVADTMKIKVEDLNDDVKYIVTLYEVYPKTVTPVQMGYDQKDIMKLSVTMNYKYWRSEVISRQEPASRTNASLPIDIFAERPEVDTTVTNFPEVLENGNPLGDVSAWGRGW
jgi:hypothetical protein